MIGMHVSDSERAKQQGKRLRALREQRDISKGRLMDALGLTTTNGYDLYERGKSVIRLDRVAEWAEAFGISDSPAPPPGRARAPRPRRSGGRWWCQLRRSL